MVFNPNAIATLCLMAGRERQEFLLYPIYPTTDSPSTIKEGV
jgi:hypothetical protein